MPGYPACCLRYPKKMLYWDHADYSLTSRYNPFVTVATALGYDVDTSADVGDGAWYTDGDVNDYRVIVWTQTYNEDEAVPSWYTDIKTNGWLGTLVIFTMGASDLAYAGASADPDDPLDTDWVAQIRADWYLTNILLGDFRLARQASGPNLVYSTADGSVAIKHPVYGEAYTDGNGDDWWVIEHPYLFGITNTIDSANRTGAQTDYYISGQPDGCGHAAIAGSHTGGLTDSGGSAKPLVWLVDYDASSNLELSEQKWMWHTTLHNSGTKCNAIIARGIVHNGTDVLYDNHSTLMTHILQRLYANDGTTVWMPVPTQAWHVALESGTDADDDKWVAL